MYGEYRLPTSFTTSVAESPPCVWGVPFCLSGFLSIQRITPMCMGSTISGITPYSAYGNHPHVYGEYQGISSMAVAERESPPCVWGVHGLACVPVAISGITPMCMGSTIIFSSRIASIKNHPHVYGEYFLDVIVWQVLPESPPCVWGVHRPTP